MTVVLAEDSQLQILTDVLLDKPIELRVSHRVAAFVMRFFYANIFASHAAVWQDVPVRQNVGMTSVVLP